MSAPNPPALPNAKELKRFKSIKWLLFTLFGGLLPLACAYLLPDDNVPHKDWGHVLGHGDLYMISSVLAIGAIGEVSGRQIGNQNSPDTTAYVALFGIFVAIIDAILSAFQFAFVSIDLAANGKPRHPYHTAEMSLLLFVFAGAVGFGLIWLSQDKV